MTKRKLGTRIDTIDLIDGPYLEESLKQTKWRKKGKLQKMPQPQPKQAAPYISLADALGPMDESHNYTYEDAPMVEDRPEKLPVRSKVRIGGA